MHKLMLFAAVAALAGCSQDKAAAPAEDANAVADANAAAPAAMTPAAMSLNGTTWEFSEDNKPMVVSIDSSGNYITETGDGGHVDHGTYAVKDGKDCFTSAMGDKSTNCYTTTPEVAIGASAPSTDDKGVTLDYKRVEYRELKMPG